MGHWYKDNQPFYEINRKDGKGKRATTLKDAKELGLLPSVTTIIHQVRKEMLEKWKLGQAIQASWLCRYISDYDNYKNKVLFQSKSISEQAANRGNQIHNALEQLFLGRKCDPEEVKYTQPIYDWINKTLFTSTWEPEKIFSNGLYGGKMDLWSRKGIIIDFKTKAKREVGKDDIYDDYVMQLAAYKEGTKHQFNDLDNVRCMNILISTETPGQFYVHEWTIKEVERGRKMFDGLLTFWQEQVNFWDWPCNAVAKKFNKR